MFAVGPDGTDPELGTAAQTAGLALAAGLAYGPIIYHRQYVTNMQFSKDYRDDRFKRLGPPLAARPVIC